MSRRVRVIVLAAVASAVVAGVMALGVWSYVNAPYGGDSAAWVYLPRGSSRSAMCDSLAGSLGERFAGMVMRVYGVAAGDSAEIYGAYRIEPGDRAKDIARRLVRHRQTPVRVTFNNVRTMEQLAERVAAQMDFSAEEFLRACDSVLPAAGFGRAEYAAAFFPDTYEFYWTESPVRAVERLLKTRNDFWNEERRARALQLGLTPVKVAVIASIAEEETNDRRERGMVARLYMNRLERGMKLQADPTVKFAVGDFGLRRILSSHLQTPSAYNTYVHAGLPPGPIRVVSAQTLESVLGAAEHDYLYMCAKEDFSGLHNFARDYATHMANAQRYRRALDARGIR